MKHELPDLPYAQSALAPHISAETLEYHYGKHHQTYVNNLNNLVPGTEFEESSLEDIIAKAPAGTTFNNAAQIWNHTCYWSSMSPQGGGDPSGAAATAINTAFGSFEEFKKQFTQKATTNFGAGWTWLVKNSDGTIAIENTSNAGNPLTNSQTPIITCDVWEHAYYIDYRNRRPDYLEAWWRLINWEAVAKGVA